MPDFKMTDEVKRRLVGLMPFSMNGKMPFTPAEYEGRGLPKEVVPVFFQRAYTKEECQILRDKFNQDGGMGRDDIMEYGRKSVKGWEKVFDLATGEMIDYKADSEGEADPGLYEQIPELIKTNLFTQACRISGLLGPQILADEEVQGLKY